MSETAPQPPAQPEQPPHSAASEIQAASAGMFLVGKHGHEIVVRSLAGQPRVVVPAAAWWLYDAEHELLWSLFDGTLSATDLRTGSPPMRLATGLTGASEIWIKWTSASGPRYVRTETGCESSLAAVEMEIGDQPVLRRVDTDTRHPFLADGLSWLKHQSRRPPRARPAGSGEAALGFPPDAQKVALPDPWAGCDDEERCGLAVAFGSSRLQLVLVGDKFGADCWQRSCLLFNPATKEFSSPPVLSDPQTGELSLPPEPARWASARDAMPGVCGPYLFGPRGSAFLVRSYVCTMMGQCQKLDGEAIGWLEPGAVVGEPG